MRKAAYEAIWTIATLYYDRLQAYMQPLFELTLRTIREDQEEVALNAMEFWSSLCDEEVCVCCVVLCWCAGVHRLPQLKSSVHFVWSVTRWSLYILLVDSLLLTGFEICLLCN